MPQLNFKSQFKAAVLIGTKCQTIRAPRKTPIKVGDPLYLYTGMRTKQCQQIRIDVDGVLAMEVQIDGRLLKFSEIQDLAERDGFGKYGASKFAQFFQNNHGLPFSGQLIKWKS